MDAAILDEEQAVRAADESFDEVASALAKVADLLREAGEALAPAHQTLMQKAVNQNDGDNHDA
jgi:acyl-CoA reductase-like NAD-dependent aldehyde dehydrogenase